MVVKNHLQAWRRMIRLLFSVTFVSRVQTTSESGLGNTSGHLLSRDFSGPSGNRPAGSKRALTKRLPGARITNARPNVSAL